MGHLPNKQALGWLYGQRTKPNANTAHSWYMDSPVVMFVIDQKKK